MWACLERLGSEPDSLWRAVDELDDELFFGWTLTVGRLTDVFDRLGSVYQAIAQSNSKRRVKALEPAARPEDNSKYEPASLDDVGSFFAS